MRRYYLARFPHVSEDDMDERITREYPQTVQEQERCEELAEANAKLCDEHNSSLGDDEADDDEADDGDGDHAEL